MSGGWAPGLATLTGYQRRWLRGDVLAGLTVTAYLVPQVMAYAALAGVPVIAGLWAAVVALGVYAVLGSSRQLSVGPESTTALMTAAVVAPLAAGDGARYVALSAALALVVGVLCLVGSLARVGFLANLLSGPVLTGYMTGVAVLMIASQLGKVSGITVSGDEFTALAQSFIRNLTSVHWPTVILAAGVLALLWALDRWAPRWPGPLIAVLAATVAGLVLSVESVGIQVVGVIPAGFPEIGVPQVQPADLAALLLPAVGVAIVGFSDNVLTARAFAARSGGEVDANTELRALGVANLGVGMAQGFPVSSSGSRTALADSVGGRTQMYSLVCIVAVVLVLVAGRGVLANFPLAALGALVIYAAGRLVDLAAFRRLARFRRSELVLALATTVAVLTLGVLYGVLTAVGLSILDLLRRMAHAHDSVLGFVPGVPGMHDVEDYPNAKPVPGLVIYRYDAPLCFANAEDFRRRALAAVDANDTPVEWFVLNADANVEVDLTALDALDTLRQELQRRGITFAMARVKQDLRDALAAAGMIPKIGEDRIYLTLSAVVEAFRDRDQAS
ncbi:sulfate ABC transporter [Mycolicibacterium phlei]|uniref:Sulfate transporter n=1 Tax=Mycolicibacterium phlei DSM 43239 = CCUG 21000 TaxID=1226750 RepID=A0A5N5VGR9_MYCPH|nr:SulP family inorganic anion transporter [Mycolicibacterium phlei]VEG11219.1 sulfate ABC transporter [Mycobacteroides chelonae]AMO63122.1 putative sulfate transporter [Mycolicibacterium phlei]EID09612.1 putative sulfate-transport transmembrane protein ABC transporter [Mycolicibacterium phlei RIVM601174]KAB7760007.1 sulfate transporter [Mycolicibacterium phlei DSM 43239 = CCUG 21000]KXW64379.1 sulfate transporter [Mycolicibacterium phlei DSM 43072]